MGVAADEPAAEPRTSSRPFPFRMGGGCKGLGFIVVCRRFKIVVYSSL